MTTKEAPGPVTSSGARVSRDIEMLFARLQLTERAARSFLIAAPRFAGPQIELAIGLARAALGAGSDARVLVAGEVPAAVEDVPMAPLRGEGSLDPLALREDVRSFDGYTFVAGAGVLDSPATLLAVAAVEAVVLVAARGRTQRQDLRRSAIEIRRAGGRIAGAVLRG